MKIDSANIQFMASHRATMRAEVRETVRAWVGDQPPEAPGQAGPSIVAISAAARMAVKAAAPPPAPAAIDEAKAIEDATERAENDPVLYFLKLVIESMTGLKVKTVSADDMPAQAPSAAPVADHPEPPPRAGFGIAYNRHEVREETEHITFRAQGLIRTADGREIRLHVDLAMFRSYREESSVSLRAGDAVRKDPLVINFDGTAAQLQNRRFSFDLDADGSPEQVPLLTGSHGYLALDRNGNGKIDNGKELFGPSSGDGFAELAEYDSDGNGWIDDNDPVFAQLRIWMQDDKGGGTLDTAKSHGVGALYLGRAETPFALNDSANRELGVVRSTGIYLAENGDAGSLQQIDLMV